jgi:ATP-dependent DNA ligase
MQWHFSARNRRLSALNELKGKSTKIVLVAFDLLYLNGHDLRQLPLHRRKAELKGRHQTSPCGQHVSSSW